MKEIPRRNILRLGAGMVFLAAGYGVYKSLSEVERREVIDERSKRIPTVLRAHIPDRSVAVGISPDKNSTANGLALANDLNSFPQCMVYFLLDLTQTKVFDEMKSATKKGIIPIVSFGYQLGLTSNYIEFKFFLKELLGRMESYDCPYVLRPFFEINGEWTREWWGDITEKEFVSGWKNMYDFIHNNSSNAHVALCLNSSIYIDPTNPHPFEKWFPGEDKMDIFAADIYKKSSANLLKAENIIFPYYPMEVNIGPDIAEMNYLAPNIPKAVTEIGSFDNEGWTTIDAVNYLLKLNINFWSTFAWDKFGVGETFWNPIHYPEEIYNYKKELSRVCYIATDNLLRGRPDVTIRTLLQSSVK